MDELQKKLDMLEWSFDALLKHLDRVFNKKIRDREKHREYFEMNKKKLYEYHKKYREAHPAYKERKRVLARQNGK
jgi:cellulose biosynthesis protein BcsQ